MRSTEETEPDGQALADTAVARLEHAIVTGELRLGQKLSEHALAEQFGIGRGPLREAFRTLENRRLVERKPFAGARVTNPSPDEIEQLLVLREALEGMSSRHAAENMTLREIRNLRAATEDLVARLQSGDFDATYFENSDNDFHRQIARGSRNRFLEEMICRDLHPLLRIFRYQTTTTGRDRTTGVNQDHAAILEAIERRDADGAEQLMRQHVAAARRAS